MLKKYLLAIVLLFIIGCNNAVDEEYIELEVRNLYLEYDENGEINCAIREDGEKVCLKDLK